MAHTVAVSLHLVEPYSKGPWVKVEFTCPWAHWGPCDQMFLQQGFFSSVFSAPELFKDKALMAPRTTSLLPTFLWISVAKEFNRNDTFTSCYDRKKLQCGLQALRGKAAQILEYQKQSTYARNSLQEGKTLKGAKWRGTERCRKLVKVTHTAHKKRNMLLVWTRAACLRRVWITC